MGGLVGPVTTSPTRVAIADAGARRAHVESGCRSGERKVRARVTVAVDATADDVLAAALADERVRAQLGGRPVRKHVLVPGRMVSLVI